MTTLFVEQPLDLPVSANNYKLTYTPHSCNIFIIRAFKEFYEYVNTLVECNATVQWYYAVVECIFKSAAVLVLL